MSGSRAVVPEQYREGRAYFMDFAFSVEAGAFIPRPETELLVERAISVTKRRAAADSRGVRILDLCTGSGAIAISLTKYLPLSTIVASDISEAALRLAARNARALGVRDRICFLRSDLFGGIGSAGLFDIIVSNPPYVSEKDMADLPENVKAEPHGALCGGPDGLMFYRAIAAEGLRYLEKGGSLIMEMGYDQAERVREILRSAGFGRIATERDYAGIERIVTAER